MTRVTAPCRLHFGLFNVPTDPPSRWPGFDGGAGRPMRTFGGVGLLVDRPGLAVAARPASSWQFEGPLASRVQIFAHRFAASGTDTIRPMQILVEHCPDEHIGLGVGTQLGMAVAKAIAVEAGLSEVPPAEMARRVGRGERSAIGVHGFDGGGLIVEPGKAADEAISPLSTRVYLPDEWRMAIFLPVGAERWHGSRERSAFQIAASSPRPPAVVEAPCRIALMEMLPALAAENLDDFGDAVYEFNRRAGEPFAAVQAGAYASREVAELVGAIRGLGVRGVGQSSWGPAVFAILPSAHEAGWLLHQLRGTARGWIAKPSTGHRIERD